MVMKILFMAYKYFGNIRLFQWFAFKMIRIFNGGEVYSITLRKIFKEYYKVDIGMYTHGCFIPGLLPENTSIGRYCSIGRTTRIIRGNYPLQLKSTHALFYNPTFGIVDKDLSERVPLKIGNDVWCGVNSIILPNVREIGDGAVVAAGAVVNKDIPPYAIVAGNPARIVRYRFEKEVVDELLESKWWEKSIEEILPDLVEYTKRYSLNDR
jgi:acetyltransferase-like isoleucine patch superfamily enzyme